MLLQAAAGRATRMYLKPLAQQLSPSAVWVMGLYAHYLRVVDSLLLHLMKQDGFITLLFLSPAFLTLDCSYLRFVLGVHTCSMTMLWHKATM